LHLERDQRRLLGDEPAQGEAPVVPLHDHACAALTNAHQPLRVGLQLVLGVAGILLLAKVLEPAWGSKEFIKFILLVDTAAGMATLSLLYVLYVCGVDPKGNLLCAPFRCRLSACALVRWAAEVWAYRYTEVGGSEGIIAGCLVAVKQLMPENEVTLLGFIRFRAKVRGRLSSGCWLCQWLTGHGYRAERRALCASQLLPSLFVVCAGLTGVVLGSALSTVPFVCFGTYLSWVYLRFLQPNPELNVRCVSPLACRSLAVARVRMGLCQDALT